MKTSTQQVCYWHFKNLSTFCAVMLIFSLSSSAQFRTYNKVYSDNLKGGSTIIGNTLTQVITNGQTDTVKMNHNRANGNSIYGNDNANIQYVDIDGNAGSGAGTRNSSSADLFLPAGTNIIKLARLYWGGRVKMSDFNIALDTFKRIKIKFDTGSYTEYAASQIDKNAVGSGNSSVNQYQAFTDITALVQQKGAGTYTVGNAPLSIGAVGSGGNYGGWCMVVVYENLILPYYSSIRVYDGFQQVFNGGATQISSVILNGLNVPSGSISWRDAKMGAMVWEGDANLKLDYLKINNINFQNELNAVDNPWNGTITDTGKHVATKNPSFTNQMGIDIDQFYVGTGFGIHPGDTSVLLEFGTEADQYFPGLFTFQIKTNDPTVVIDKLVKDANNNKIAEANEQLTYTLRAKNTGVGNANFCIITDTLPPTMSYVPGSMKVISGNGFAGGTSFTDNAGDDQADFNTTNKVVSCRIGSGADALHGGILIAGEVFEVEFKVTVNNPGVNATVPSIINVARITAISDAGVRSTDDATVILEPQGGPLPVTLKSFDAVVISSDKIVINWLTSMEINCSRYEVERSVDGIHFTLIGTIPGSGNKSVTTLYNCFDNVATINSGIVYYRLKQVDIDGKKSISRVISVRLKKVNNDITVSPNPFSGYVNLTVEWKINELVNVKVYNMIGREIISKSIQMYKGSNYIFINELSALPAGNYVIRFNTNETGIFKQITKQ